MLSRMILKRRQLLMSLGSASFLAAPVFRETFAEAQGGSFPVRFVPIFLPGNAADRQFTLSGVLSALAPYQSDSITFTACNNASASAIWGETAEPHAAELRTLLTGDSSVKPVENASVWAKSDSIDQMIAAKISAQSKFTTLQFGVVTETKANPPDQRRMIFKNGTPQPPVQNPMEMLTRLFPNGTPTPTPGGMPSPIPSVDTSADGRSIIDRLVLEVTALKAVAGAGEQAKLDQHLTSLRELEKQIAGSTPGGVASGGVSFTPGAGCAAPTLTPAEYSQGPVGDFEFGSPQIDIVTPQMFELLYQALHCDFTRVASMQLLGTAHTEVNFLWLGVKDDHHGLEHNQTNAQTGANLNKVQSFFASEVAKFLERLKSTPEGNGNMLDNTLVFFFTDFGQSSDHSHDNIPFFTFGRAGGKVTPNRTINYNDGPHNGLLRSVLNVFDIDQAVGDGGAAGPSLA